MDKSTEWKVTHVVPDPEVPVEVYLHLSVRLSEEDMQKVQELITRVVVAETKVTTLEERMKGRVWRPFDTAPQDETEILVYRPDAGVFTARYHPSLNEDDEWDLDNYCWFTMAGEDLTRDLPTHWMPLPDGPDQTIDEEERYEKG